MLFRSPPLTICLSSFNGLIGKWYIGIDKEEILAVKNLHVTILAEKIIIYPFRRMESREPACILRNLPVSCNAAPTAIVVEIEELTIPFNLVIVATIVTTYLLQASRRDKALYHTSAPGWLKGVDAPVRRENVADNPGVLSLLVGVFVLTGLSMGHIRRLFRALPQRLWSVRRRGNAFDEIGRAHV